MSHGDPTDDALAAIASILDHSAEKQEARVEKPEARPESVDAQAGEYPEPDITEAEPVAATAPVAATPMAASDDVDGYSKAGPGPLDAIRFRWTARRDSDGSYYVDETIGLNSRPISSGPMHRDTVVAFIDAREREAHQRFENLRNDMTSSRTAWETRDHGGES